MNNAVLAFQSLVKNFNESSTDIAAQAEKLFSDSNNFLESVKQFDAVFDAHPAYEPVREYAFDLLMAHHLEANNDKEEYFDSKEWQDIEDQTIERGTELLNMLLYISEARENEVEISVDDFLYEFLLVDEDEFQDEHRIYEDLIAQQELVEEDLQQVLDARKALHDDVEIKELFVPMILFFKEPSARLVNKEQYNKLQPTERALLACMLAYNS